MKRFFNRKPLRALILMGLGTFALIQLLPVERSNPNRLSQIQASPEILQILRKACYDCHSNETTWPWYSQIAPVSWLVSSDVNEGREELNFSEWLQYDEKKRTKKLKEIRSEVIEGEMPPWTYTIMHSDAVLTTTEQELLNRWTTQLLKDQLAPQQ